MITLTDQVRIFSLLEAASRADFNPRSIHVDIFFTEINTAFLVFCPEGIAKGAVLYLMEKPLLPGELERDLLPHIMNIHGDSHADELRELAEEKIRALIFGSAMASFTVEKFGVERLIGLTQDQVDERVQEFTDLVQFDISLV